MSYYMAVHGRSPHKHKARGDRMEEKKPDRVIKRGNTTIQIFAPPPMTQEEKERRLAQFYDAAWALWDSLSTEEKLKINAQYENK